METFWQDLRYAARTLAKNPGFTAVALLTLALGIGANTAVFSTFNAFFLRWLPFNKPEQLVHIWATAPRKEYGDELRVSAANFLDWRKQARSFDDLGGYYYQSVNAASTEEPIRVQVGKVTFNLPVLLGAQPILGRSFLPEEDQRGRDKVVLLSHTYWQRHFNSDSHVLGQTVRLDGEDYAVIGVMPPTFVFPLKATQMWAPLALARDESRRGDAGPLLVIGRLKPGVTIKAAQAELDNISRGLAAEYPADKELGARVIPLQEALLFFYHQLRLLMLALLLAAGFVLLIVCSNLGNLLVARAVDRSKEVAIRTALGATRARIIRQLLTESTLLALLGAAVGVLFADSAVRVLETNMPEALYRVGEISLDARVLGFTLAVSLMAVWLFGLAPALLISRPNLTEALKEGNRAAGSGVRSRRLHNVLVVGQIALAMVLMAGAIFSEHAFVQQRHVNPGFNTTGVLTLEVVVPRSNYQDDVNVNQFYREVLARVERLPGVKLAAAVHPLPMNFELDMQQFEVEGKPQLGPQQRPEAARFAVTPDYFRAMQIPILQGNAFSEQNASGSPLVVIVNDLLARQKWPNQDPIGKRIRVFEHKDNYRVATVIGVVGDSKDFLMNQELRPQIYVPQLQSPTRRRYLVVKSSGDPLALVSSVRNEIQTVDRNVPVAEIRRMDQVILEALSPFMFAAAILGILGAGALLLSAMGIYGVIAYAVRQRTHEIGVRMALGARDREILKLVLRQGARLAGMGLGIGLVGTLALMQLIRASLGGSAFDPFVLIGTPLLLGGVALVASYVPARRASRVDPIVALRYE